MTRDESIVGLAAWLQTAPGRYLLDWERERLDAELSDAFGFHAVQLGLPELDGLRANRMPHRWLAVESPPAPGASPLQPAQAGDEAGAPLRPAIGLHCAFDALPFPNASIDLVVLPHALELARDPHLALREVERVLVPEGRVVIVGFNPASLWGLRQNAGRLWRGLGFARGRGPFLPPAGDWIGYWRLRDWLRLLGFEIEAGRFGCWRPPIASAAWLERWRWLDRVGAHWWPVFGALYFIVAVKRVRGMRLVGVLKSERRAPVAAPAAVARRDAPLVRALRAEAPAEHECL
ncbi:MAG: methyltransferase domain-containing protein [Rubrivivax sp.]